MPGGGLQFAADNVRQYHLAGDNVKPIDIHMVHALICHQKVFIVMGHSGTVDMGPEIPLRHTPQPLMEDFIRDFADGAILRQAQHRQLAVVVACHKKVSVRIVRGDIAAPHAVDGGKIDEIQTAVRSDGIGLHAKVRDGIQILSTM